MNDTIIKYIKGNYTAEIYYDEYSEEGGYRVQIFEIIDDIDNEECIDISYLFDNIDDAITSAKDELTSHDESDSDIEEAK
jgi:hypothetical protein